MPRICIPYLDGAEVEIDDGSEGLPLSESGAAAALAAFLTLTPADRLADSRHLHACYRAFRDGSGEASRIDAEMGAPDRPEDIWRHVTLDRLYVLGGSDGDGRPYLVLDGACDWDPEHGLMLVWRDGRTLCKVGGNDGHLTNVFAYADPSLADVIHHSPDPRFQTRRD